MKKVPAFFWVFLLISILAAAQKIELVNGVRIIHNEKGGKWGANPEVKLELVRTIGGLDAEENLSFNNPEDIVRPSPGAARLSFTPLGTAARPGARAPRTKSPTR